MASIYDACMSSFLCTWLGNQMHVASILNYEITMQRNVHRSESFCRRPRQLEQQHPLSRVVAGSWQWPQELSVVCSLWLWMFSSDNSTTRSGQFLGYDLAASLDLWPLKLALQPPRRFSQNILLSWISQCQCFLLSVKIPD